MGRDSSGFERERSKHVVGKTVTRLRCAIYTRKSTEHGLEQEFNSLHAQREACEAYIKSQVHEGWHGLSKRYDDPAYSGGNMNRPALQSLLKDIDAGLVDVVVVYKIDRLTRSLADFAKLVEAFDAKKISFVAVTQQFNTTTSMGRLTLNVLLSFAQFERELSSERVRDKVAASRKKGKWMGGSVPLGYDSKDKKLIINASEAKTVRMLFERYLALGSLLKLTEELRTRGVVTKKRMITGNAIGSIPFTYGPLAYLLKNRTYVGESGHNGAWYPGEHDPIIDRMTFEKVQSLLKSNSVAHRGRQQPTEALLTGLLYDDRGNRMSPTYTIKSGVRYPFYVSSAIRNGRKTLTDSIKRVPAADIESSVVAAVKSHTYQCDNSTPRDLMEKHVARIIIHTSRLAISLRAVDGADARDIQAPWQPVNTQKRARIEGEIETGACRSPDQTLVQAIVRAHAWLRLLKDGTYGSVEALAESVDMHPKVVRNRIGLAFLPPTVLRSILHGEQPADFTLTQATQMASTSWAAQRKIYDA
jgi:site-specific DNA recombinase